MMGDMERLTDEDATEDAGEGAALDEFSSFEEDMENELENELEDDSMEPFEAGPNTREQFEEEEPEEARWLEEE